LKDKAQEKANEEVKNILKKMT